MSKLAWFHGAGLRPKTPRHSTASRSMTLSGVASASLGMQGELGEQHRFRILVGTRSVFGSGSLAQGGTRGGTVIIRIWVQSPPRVPYTECYCMNE